jgi:GTP-binding protein
MTPIKVTSAKFMRGVNGSDDILDDGIPQVALIGRSNVGKSTLINSLTGEKGLARTSDTPGLTQEINVYALDTEGSGGGGRFYLLDLPGYGFAKVPEKVRAHIQKMNWWYLFESSCEQLKTILVLDANVGPSNNDLEMLGLLHEYQKNIVIVANKIDKIKPSEYDKRMAAIDDLAHGARVIPYSSVKKTGMEELLTAIYLN